MNALVSFEYLAVSPSSRRAWIEIPVFPEQTTRNKVALLAEGVDRNMGEVEDTPWMPTVALLAEGVDRNSLGNCGLPTLPRSPSSRRAWIEIVVCRAGLDNLIVALLAEGVDRNSLLSCST